MYDRLEAMRQQLNRTPHLLRLGRLFSETVLLKVDDNEFYLTFDKGALTDIQPGPSRKTPWRFALYTDADALEQFWQARPAPGGRNRRCRLFYARLTSSITKASITSPSFTSR